MTNTPSALHLDDGAVMTLSLGEMRKHLGPSLLAIKTRIPGY